MTYREIQIGQRLAKSGAFPSGVVIKSEHWTTTDGRELYRLTLDNGDRWYGFEDREIKLWQQ